LSESIRYASGDPIESWLNNLLCLDVSNAIPNLSRLGQSVLHISFESENICLSPYFFSPDNRLPPPSECDLYYVNRDTLFSYHRDSELFLQVKSDLSGFVGWLMIHIFMCLNSVLKYIVLLQRMMALYVASHYKNSPNDLQLMADAPAHHLFVLLGILGFFVIRLLFLILN